MKFHIALLVSLAGFSSCGEGGGESVFLYFINAYNGVESVTIIGPTGPLVQSAGFGDRMGVDSTGSSAVCPSGKQCIPIEYDRNLGGEFTAIVDGAPDTYEFSYPMFSLYPQETATMLFAGRNSNGSGIETHLVRHVQSISQSCVLTFINALSLDNSQALGNQTFDIIPEFRISPADAGYFDERNSSFPTTCGDIDDKANPKHIALTRDLGAALEASPWFFYTPDCEESAPGSLCPVWVNGGTEPGSVEPGPLVQGTVNSIEYYKCVQGAIKFDTGAMGEETCPMGGPTWADVEIDSIALAGCLRPVTKSVIFVPPDETKLSLSQSQVDICSPTLRFRTPGIDTVFGPQKGTKKGRHQKGALIEITLEIGSGNEYFVALMGRPVNPLIWQWESGTSIANLNDFPYVNGKDSRIGKY